MLLARGNLSVSRTGGPQLLFSWPVEMLFPQAMNIKAEDLSDVEQEEYPEPITFPI
jgi:hypothetical protein